MFGDLKDEHYFVMALIILIIGIHKEKKYVNKEDLISGWYLVCSIQL